MSRQNLKPTEFKSLSLNLSKCTVFEGKARKNSKTCDKVYVPSGWAGKSIFVVLKNE